MDPANNTQLLAELIEASRTISGGVDEIADRIARDPRYRHLYPLISECAGNIGSARHNLQILCAEMLRASRKSAIDRKGLDDLRAGLSKLFKTK